MSEIDIIARAIKSETDKFANPVHLYIAPEVAERWDQANPGKDYYLEGPNDDDLEGYRIIARAVLAALINKSPPPQQ